MTKLAKDLRSITRQLNALAKKAESLAMTFDQAPDKPAPSKKAVRPVSKAAAPKEKNTTPTDQVLRIMKRFKKGITVEGLRDKSGFNEKQISNIVHRACKKGKMKRLGRGVYSVF